MARRCHADFVVEAQLSFVVTVDAGYVLVRFDQSIGMVHNVVAR